MNVLIATKDTVFCRMLTLEFSEKGFSVLCAQSTEETEQLYSRAQLALIDADFLSEDNLPNFPYDVILFGYAETFDQIPTQELTKYHTLIRPFAIEDFFADLLVPEEENGAIHLRVPKRKSPAESLALDENTHTVYYKGEKIALTQKEFAHLLGVSQSMVSKWESEDYNFTVEALANICDKLDWDLNICMRPRSKNAFYQIGKGTRNNWVTKDNPTNNHIWMGVAS
jgi:DNA-binding response OmpR family regulator